MWDVGWPMTDDLVLSDRYGVTDDRCFGAESLLCCFSGSSNSKDRVKNPASGEEG